MVAGNRLAAALDSERLPGTAAAATDAATVDAAVTEEYGPQPERSITERTHFDQRQLAWASTLARRQSAEANTNSLGRAVLAIDWLMAKS